jgi:hypothetical protein
LFVNEAGGGVGVGDREVFEDREEAIEWERGDGGEGEGW